MQTESVVSYSSERSRSSRLFPYTTLFRSKEHQPDYIAASFDLPGRTFRDDIVSDYKANRRPMPDELARSEEHTSELQSLRHLVCRLLLEKKKNRVNPSTGWQNMTAAPQPA